MFLKNTLKNLLVTALFVSSIAISTNAEAARKPQLPIKTGISIGGAVIIASVVAVTALLIGLKSYFAKKNVEEKLKILRAANNSGVESNPECANDITYESIKTRMKAFYNKQIFSPKEDSLKIKYPIVTFLYDATKPGLWRKINMLCFNQSKLNEDSLTEEVNKLTSTLTNEPKFKKNKTSFYAEDSTKFSEEYSNKKEEKKVCLKRWWTAAGFFTLCALLNI